MNTVTSLPDRFNLSHKGITMKMLMERSLALSNKEIEYWIQREPEMNQEQIHRFFRILLNESLQLIWCEQFFTKEISNLIVDYGSNKDLGIDERTSYAKRKELIKKYVDTCTIEIITDDDILNAMFVRSGCSLLAEQKLL